MSNKPKFLKTAADMYKQASKYGQLLNSRKKGIPDDFYMTTPQLRKYYTKLSKITRDDSTLTKNFARQIDYNDSFLDAVVSGLSPRHAKLVAQHDVAEKFGISIRQVQRSVDMRND